MHIIFESVLLLLTQTYQNKSMLVELTACQSWRIFLRHSVVAFCILTCLSLWFDKTNVSLGAV